jgi:hypothetical protein
MAIFNFSQPKDQNKFQRDVLDPFWKEMLAEDPFNKYMGSTGNSMIALQKNVDKGKGAELVFSMTYNSKVNEVYDENTLEGKGTLDTPVNCTMNIGKTRFAVGAKDFDIAEYLAKFQFTKSVNEQITIKRELLTKRRNINQFAWCFAYGSKGKNDHISKDYLLSDGQVTSDFESYFTPKIKTCVINQIDANGDGISSDRVLFGAESIRNVIAAGQTVQQRCVVGVPGNNGNIGTANYDDDTSGYCNIDHINNLLQIAKTGGRKINTEGSIKPMYYTNYQGFKGMGYTYFIGPRVKARFLKNPIVKEMLIRPFREDGQPTYFNGTDYIGRISGIDIVCIDEFDYLNFTTDAGVDIGYGALCGSMAFAKAICTTPKITIKEMDHENQYEMGIRLLDGMKVVKFPSKRYQNVNTFPYLETGIVHSFTLI